jgi:hypothetical protein
MVRAGKEGKQRRRRDSAATTTVQDGNHPESRERCGSTPAGALLPWPRHAAIPACRLGALRHGLDAKHSVLSLWRSIEILA